MGLFACEYPIRTMYQTVLARNCGCYRIQLYINEAQSPYDVKHQQRIGISEGITVLYILLQH